MDIPIALGVVQGFSTIFGASSKNNQVKKAEASAKDAAAIQNKQLAAKTAQEAEQRRRESAVIRGRTLAAAGETGFAANSFGDLLAANDLQTGLNLDILDKNLRMQIERVNSGLNADLTELDSRKVSGANMAIGGLTAGAQGFSTGISLMDNYDTWSNR